MRCFRRLILVETFVGVIPRISAISFLRFVLEVQQKKRPFERRLPRDKPVQPFHAITCTGIACGRRNGFVHFLLQWRKDPALLHLSTHKADGHIQCNAVHPCREGAGRVVLWPSFPELGRDLLCKVIPVFRSPAIGIHCLENNGSMRLKKGFELFRRLVRHVLPPSPRFLCFGLG